MKSKGVWYKQFLLLTKIRKWRLEKKGEMKGLEEECLRKGGVWGRCLGALTMAGHLSASCVTRRCTAQQRRPPPWGRWGRTPRSRARSPGGPTCGGRTWCCWVSRSAHPPPPPAKSQRHTERSVVNKDPHRRVLPPWKIVIRSIFVSSIDSNVNPLKI